MIAVLGATAAQWRVSWLGDWSDEWLVVVAGALALTLLMTALNVRRARPRRRAFVLLGARTGTLVAAFLLFLQPALVRETLVGAKNRVPVLVDVSRSMALAQGERSRLAHAQRFLLENEWFWTTLGARHEPVFYAFGETLRNFERPAAGELRATDDATELGVTLARITEMYRDRDVGGLLLLSDGIDTGPLGARANPEGELDPQTVKALRGLDAPVYTFGVHATRALRDVAVRPLVTNSFAFVLNLTEVAAEFECTGLDGARLDVVFRADGAEVERRTLSVAAGQRTLAARFGWLPPTAGKHVVSVEVAAMPGEVTVANNVRAAVVNVLRDRVRVLQLAGQPTADVRFLRGLLKRDPDVDLISFFLLIRPTNYTPAGDDETALIPFPADEVFIHELGGFDIVILQDFPYGPFGTPRHLGRLAAFVRAGGSLLVVGGKHAFSSGGFAGTEIETVLPVRLLAETRPLRVLSEEPFRPRRTAAGRVHPILQLGDSEATTEAAWQALPLLEGINRFAGLQPGATTLLGHPRLVDGSGEPAPVVAVREVDRGRVLAVATDSTWFWAFRRDAEGQGDPRHYSRFWQNAFRWLTRDPSLGPVQVHVLGNPARAGGALDAQVDVRQPDYQPAAGVPVRVHWQRVGVGPADTPDPSPAADAVQAATDGSGRAAVRFSPPVAGVYRIEAEAQVAGQTLAGFDLVQVESADREFERVVPAAPLLQRIAAATGGAHFPLDAPPPKLELKAPPADEVVERTVHDLWSTPWAALGIGLLLALEWFLRRRWGLA